jgi:cytochrome c-type biogenesis protein CcmH
MRARIDELLEQGWSDEQIVGHFVARYGDWIVLDPPFDARSAALWLLPPAALIAALLAIRRWRRAGSAATEAAELAEAQRARLRAEIAALRRREGSR